MDLRRNVSRAVTAIYVTAAGLIGAAFGAVASRQSKLGASLPC